VYLESNTNFQLVTGIVVNFNIDVASKMLVLWRFLLFGQILSSV